MSGWIGVDLDGTLAVYDEWRGFGHIGKPIPKMVERIKGWLKAGTEVRIFTARVSNNGVRMPDEPVREPIERWLVEEAGLPILKITCVKDFEMMQLWDDRAVGVEFNTGERIGEVPCPICGSTKPHHPNHELG